MEKKIYLVGNLEDIDRAIYGNPSGMDEETLNGLLPAFAKDIRDTATVLNTVFDGSNANHHACRLRDVARLLDVLGYRTEDEYTKLEEELHKYKSGFGHYTAKCKKLEEENAELRKQVETIENERMELFYLNEGACKKIAELDEENDRLESENFALNRKSSSMELLSIHFKETYKEQLHANKILLDKLAAIEEII